MPTHIDLILPGLFDLPLNELDEAFLNLKLPALNRLLSDAKAIANDCYEFEAMIATCMGLPDQKYLPFAQAYVEPSVVENRHRYLLCRGIHLKANMHNALVIPLENNSVDADDEALIFKDLMDLFSEDCELKYLQSGIWLMHLKNCDPSDCYPHYLSVIGKTVSPFIQQSRQALPWYKLMNEMQMFMHQHSINTNRLETGLLPINSLWFWGAGDLATLNTQNSHWFCDDEPLIRLADSYAIQHSRLAQIATIKGDSDSVIIDLSLLEALKTSNQQGLMTHLEHLETTIFQPLQIAAKLNHSTLRLRAGYEIDLKITPLDRLLSPFKFWQTQKNLIDISLKNAAH